MIPTHVIARNGKPWRWLHQGRSGWHYAHAREQLHWYAMVGDDDWYQRWAEPVTWDQLVLF